jgi:hypothetical protein
MTTAMTNGQFEDYSVPEHQLVRVAHLGLEGLAVWIRGAGGVLVLDAALHTLQPITSILQLVTKGYRPPILVTARGLKIAAWKNEL